MNLNGSDKQLRQTVVPRLLDEGRLTSGVLTNAEGPALQATRKSDGFLLLNSSMVPIFINRTAADILAYPKRPGDLRKGLDEFLVGKVRAVLLSKESARTPTLVSEFRSGRREYQCRAYSIGSSVREDPEASLAVILQRGVAGAFSVNRVSERFHLSDREREVMQYLVNGLTTKQIANGMAISPNTVKAFLRMIMVKMGVSTRSAVVAKALMLRM
jgi:DNA-binding CsgD family transcriptional regulator